MWDCNAFLSHDLFHELRALDPPLRAIAISHPHVRTFPFVISLATLTDLIQQQFYSTSLTWARCLGVPLLISKADAHWFQRSSDTDPGEIEWFHNDAPLEDGVNVIQCGGLVHASLPHTPISDFHPLG